MNQRTECLSVLQSVLKPGGADFILVKRHTGDVNYFELRSREKIER